MKHLLRTVFELALIVAMLASLASIASAEPNMSIQVNGYIDGEAPVHIHYDANGGTGSFDGPELEAGGTDTVLPLSQTGITRDGHTFTEWNTAPGGNGAAYAPGDTVTLGSDLTLFAQWEKDSTGGGTAANPAKTGDTQNMLLWSGILIASLLMMLLLLWLRRRGKSENENNKDHQ